MRRPSAAPGDAYLRDVARWTWRVKLSTSLSLDLMSELRERAEEEAIKVFAHNLKDLLLAAPAGARPTLGLDPGIRTGVKVAAIDATGKVVDDDDGLSVPAAQRRQRRAGRAGGADRAPQDRADRHRQRHGAAARPSGLSPTCWRNCRAPSRPR